MIYIYILITFIAKLLFYRLYFKQHSYILNKLKYIKKIYFNFFYLDKCELCKNVQRNFFSPLFLRAMLVVK